MKRKPLKIFMAAVFLLLLFGSGYVLGQSRYAPFILPNGTPALSEQSSDAFRPFFETLSLLEDEYYQQPLDEELLAEGAINGMLEQLDDPNTRYLSPEMEHVAREAMEGNLEGIGAEITSIDGDIVIVAPYEGSPADEAGILPGDILREANGTPLTGLDPAEAATIVRGPAGTTVSLLIEREGELIALEVTRGVIKIPSVRAELLDEGIAYVRLSRFANNTIEELNNELDEVLANNPVGIILDLRGNPGGNLTAAVDVANAFLDEGTILVESFGNGKEIQFTSDEEGSAEELPLVILIDHGSASASEVVAGAVQDRERGVLIGSTSFGKGTVQVWKRLSNDGGIRITVARWLTPDGNWVHQEGLEPDFFVALPDGEDQEFTDTQLEAAVDYIMGRPVVESDMPEGG